MSTKIFVNLPVRDLQRSIDFFTGLRYKFDPQFTDENATCLVIDEDHIHAIAALPRVLQDVHQEGHRRLKHEHRGHSRAER